MQNLDPRNTTFDYALAGSAAATLQGITARIRRNKLKAAEAIIEIGRNLLEAKQLLPHGAFSAYLRDECEYSDRTARRLMQVAEVFQHQIGHRDRFDVSALYLLSADSTPAAALDEALKLATAGRRITKQAAIEIVGRHRPPIANGLTDAERNELAACEARIKAGLARLKEHRAELDAAGITADTYVEALQHHGLPAADAEAVAACMFDEVVTA